jgi:putative flippase GtrA
MFAKLNENINKHFQVIKYLIAGGLGTVVSLALLYFFTDIIGIWYLVSASLAFIISFFVSFFLQKFWTFADADREAMRRQIAAFLLVSLINFALNGLLMLLFVEVFKIWYMSAQLVASGLIAIESYFIYKIFIFNKKIN